MKVVIAGTRYVSNNVIYSDYGKVRRAVENSGFAITAVISGTAVGVDRLGEVWATSNNIPIIEKPANWSLGKKAGPIRNKEMAELCDAAIIIWDGKSAGTYNMIQNMIKLKKPYHLELTSGDITDFM